MRRIKLLSCLLTNIGVLVSACNSSSNNDVKSTSTDTTSPATAMIVVANGYMDRYVTFGDEIEGAYTYIPTFEVVEQLENSYIVDYCFRFLDYGHFDKTKDYLKNHFNVVTKRTGAFYKPPKFGGYGGRVKSEDDFIFDYDNLTFKIRIEQDKKPRKGGCFYFNADPDNIHYDRSEVYATFCTTII